MHAPISLWQATPTLWTLHIWLLLVLYPTLSYKCLSVFNCVWLRGTAYLRDDPSSICFVEQWYGWAAVAIAGSAVYTVGIPLAAWLACWRHHQSSNGARKVALLLSSYRPQFWWFESFDLMRKFFLASAITLLAPDTKLQIWVPSLPSPHARTHTHTCRRLLLLLPRPYSSWRVM